jgi:ribosomal protein S27AE
LITIGLLIASLGTFAQAKQPHKAKTHKIHTYSCPMHPEVTSSKPGKCPKCGNSLTLSKKEQMKMEVMNIYSCPMHPGVTSEKPGNCSKCGAALVLQSKPESKKGK